MSLETAISREGDMDPRGTARLDTVKLLAAAAGFIVTGAGAVLGLERITALRVWPGDTPTHVEGTSKTLLLAGLGQDSADPMVEPLEPICGPVSVMRYASRGMTERNLGDALHAYIQRAGFDPEHSQDRLNVAAHSMGLVALLAAYGSCIKRGLELPRLGDIYAFGSPLAIKHAFKGSQAWLIARSGHPGGVLSKGIVEFLGAIEKRQKALRLANNGGDLPVMSIPDCLRMAIENSMGGQPPGAWVAQARVLHRFRPQPEIFRKHIDRRTRIVHLGDPETDDVVRLDCAREGLARFCKECDARFAEVNTPGAKHADVVDMAPHLGKFLRKYGTWDATNVTKS